MRLRTLGPVNWDDIEVGEVFVWYGDYDDVDVLYKITKKKAILLESSFEAYRAYIGNVAKEVVFDLFYRLPIDIQELWITPEVKHR